MKYSLLPLTASLALAACGGGGGSTDAAAVAQSTCTPTQVVFNLYGDSTQQGLVITPTDPHGSPSPNNPGHSLQVAMDARFGLGAVVVNNHGIGGTMTRDLIASGVPIVSISLENYGVNDSQYLTIDEFKANLRKINADWFETPVDPDPNMWFGKPLNYAAYTQAVRDVAKELGKPVVEVGAAIRSYPDWQKYMSDGIHPGDVLYNYIGGTVLFNALESTVAALRCVK